MQGQPWQQSGPAPQPGFGGPTQQWAQQPPQFADRPVTAGSAGPLPRQKGSKKMWLGLGALASVVVIVAGGLYFFLGGSKPISGADTAEGAVKATLTAMESRDLLRVVELTPEAERQGLYPVIKAVADGAETLNVVDTNDPQAALSGLTMKTRDVEFSSKEIREDLVKVSMTRGSFEFEFDPDGLNPGVKETLGDSEENLRRESETVRAQDLQVGSRSNRSDAFVMVAKDPSGWYVSPLYTALEYIAVDQGVRPIADPKVNVQSFGSPEEAVKASMEAGAKVATGGDVARFANTLSPYEARAVLTYAPAFEDEGSFNYLYAASVDSAKFSTEKVSDGVVKVIPDRVEVSGEDSSYYSSSSTITIEGSCARTSSGRGDSACLGDLVGDELDAFMLRGLADPVGLPMAGALRSGAPYVVAVNDGGWHLSVIGTYFGLVADALTGLEPIDGLWLVGPDLGARVPPTDSISKGRSNKITLQEQGTLPGFSAAVVNLDGSEGRNVQIDLDCAAECSAVLVGQGGRIDYDYTYRDSSVQVSGRSDGTDARLMLFGTGSVTVDYS